MNKDWKILEQLGEKYNMEMKVCLIRTWGLREASLVGIVVQIKEERA